MKRPWFLRVANALSRFAGRETTFIVAVGLVILWALVGPVFGFSDTWQLVINTSTTIITFLMVFLIQNTQNRDTAAIQTKLDELIRAADAANNALLDLEELDESEIASIREPYEDLARQAREEVAAGSNSTSQPAPDQAPGGAAGADVADAGEPRSGSPGGGTHVRGISVRGISVRSISVRSISVRSSSAARASHRFRTRHRR